MAKTSQKIAKKENTPKESGRARRGVFNFTEQAKIEATPEFQEWSIRELENEEFSIREELRLRKEENEKWLQREVEAQKEWRRLQDELENARLQKEQQMLKIKMEWEAKQKEIENIKEQVRQREEEQLKRHTESMRRIDEFISNDGEVPPELLSYTDTNPEKEMCPFYSKTGSCRFGNSCSRNHRMPSASKILLIRQFFSYYGLQHSTPDECDTDKILEFDEKDAHKEFLEFFNDVLPEFQKCGRVVEFKVCSNFEKHLRGNTYIEFDSLRDSVKAYRIFHGRWFGGKQITVEFCNIPSWRRAICGLFHFKKCPKAQTCNFLHVFLNPKGVLQHSHRERESRERSSSRSKERDWRWSESPDRESIKSRNSDHRKIHHKRSRH